MSYLNNSLIVKILKIFLFKNYLVIQYKFETKTTLFDYCKNRILWQNKIKNILKQIVKAIEYIH